MRNSSIAVSKSTLSLGVVTLAIGALIAPDAFAQAPATGDKVEAAAPPAPGAASLGTLGTNIDKTHTKINTSDNIHGIQYFKSTKIQTIFIPTYENTISS